MCRSLEITLVSANGIKKVKHISKMDVYVVATVSGDPQSLQKTPVHKDGGSNPTWNFTMKFTIDESLAQLDHLMLIFQLRCCRHVRADKDIGEANVSVKELLNHAGDDMSAKYVTYEVKKPSGKPKGKLNFSFKFGERSHPGATPQICSPVTAYPIHTVYGSPYAPPSVAAPYPETTAVEFYPPVGFPNTADGYHSNGGHSSKPPQGYPPPEPENGYSPVKHELPDQQPTKNDDISLETLGAAIAMILMGDKVSDAAVVSSDHDRVYNSHGLDS
ncbi:Protein SRC2-like [Vitis vinifera]|uniref:Protein SRC2-like n=1 Tax=Vitis vinifera TaxID=29760 RepID=A0A438KHE6_VITVI|nr:Protein SRC2-like [Vitis vinifera]